MDNVIEINVPYHTLRVEVSESASRTEIETALLKAWIYAEGGELSREAIRGMKYVIKRELNGK